MTTTRIFALAAFGAAMLAQPVLAQDAPAEPATEAASEAAACDVAQFTMGLRFQQQSAEIKALQLQAYNLATERLHAAVEGVADPAKLAVVTDLDETVIDNSALLARDLANCHTYDAWDTWLPWERDGQPTLIPGALEFLNHANEMGVTIRYVSDRSDQQKADTLATLTALGLPQVSEDSVLLLGPPKVERRDLVAKDHQIILLLGDTLHDFDGRFRKTPLDQQKATVTEETAKWGKEWIVFPNASYGTWSEAPLTAWAAEEVIEPWE